MSDAFDVCGPLPTGVTVLEASAGTGKTYTIAALAARYVAEGIPVEQLLMVTFGRMATSELRERVRERLVSAEQGVGRALAGATPEDDEVVRLLATGSPDEVRTRHERLARALADFDSATIATTHAFCQEVLGGLGVLGDIGSDVTLVEDISELTGEVVDDLYVRRFGRRDTPEFSRSEAMKIAQMAIDNPAAPIEPDGRAQTIRSPRCACGSADAARDELDAPQAAHGCDDLRRSADAPERHARGRGRRRRGAPPAQALPRRARGRVPGHRPRAVADHADRVRRRQDDAGPDRRPETGDLRLPRRRRLRLHRGGADRRHAGHADGQPAQRPGTARRLRRAVRRGEARARGHRLPAGQRRAREPGSAHARGAGPGACPDAGRSADERRA